MLRNVFRLFLVLIAVLFVRQVIVLIARAFSQSGSAGTGQAQPERQAAAGGELRKDPVCGTFVAVSSSIKQNVDGQVVHFCSTACRDQYRVA